MPGVGLPGSAGSLLSGAKAHWGCRDGATATTISAADTWYNVAGTFTGFHLNNFTFSNPYVVVPSNGSGDLIVSYSVSFSGGSSQTYEFTLSRSTDGLSFTDCDIYSERNASAAGGIGSVSGTGVCTVVAGERLYLRVQQLGGVATNIVARDVNIMVHY